MKIAIIGGGVSGLATGFWIKKLAPNAQITVIEKDGSFGGKLKTEHIAGFNVEIGGNGFLDNKPDMLELVSAIKADDTLLKSEDASRKRFIYDKGSLYELPSSPKEFFKTKLLPISSKIRVLSEFIIPAKKRDIEKESVREFGNRRLGKNFTDIFLDAMTAGIFASTPDKLSLSAAFPMVADLEAKHGGLFKGMKAKKKQQGQASAGPGGTLTSFIGGMGEFIERLANAYEFTALLNTEVKNICPTNTGYSLQTDGNDVICDIVVMCCPAFESAKIVKSIDEELGEELRKIEYSPIAVVALGYDNLPSKLDGFGLLTTSRSGTQVLGALWDSSVFKNRANGENQLIRVMIGGQRQPHLATKDEHTLAQIAIGGVLQTMHQGAEPMLTRVYRWHKAIPNYGVGHQILVASIMQKAQKHKKLYLGGNAYYGVGMNECAKNAKDLAIAICNKFK